MWTSGYLDSPTTPAYPFGFGMSYTTFAYDAPKVNKSKIKAGETLEVSVTVTNTGKIAGSETVQCYIRDLVADIARPVKELKGFEKINLAPGEKRTVVFKLTENDLAYWNDSFAPHARFLTPVISRPCFFPGSFGISRFAISRPKTLINMETAITESPDLPPGNTPLTTRDTCTSMS
jgi:hypothetical protein